MFDLLRLVNPLIRLLQCGSALVGAGCLVRFAAEAEAADETATDSGNQYRWVYLLPLAAAYLTRSDPQRAVAAVRPLLDPGQQALPDQLEAALAAACRAWDDGDDEEAVACLRTALSLARDLGFF